MSKAASYGILALAGALALLVLPSTSLADFGYVSPRTEIPLTSPLVTGARAAGMAGVSMAVADDATAVATNPAALARLNRIELSGGFRRSSLLVDGEIAGSGFETDLSGTDFTSLRFAYPFPTFRGSLVMGLAMERVYDFGDDRLADYEDEIYWDEHPSDGVDSLDASGVWPGREDYISDGGVSALSAACAVDVSPNISLGAALTYLTGDYSKTWKWDIYDAYDASERYTDVHIEERYNADVSGLRLTVGGLFYVSEQLSAGVAIDSPTSLTFEGTETNHIARVAAIPESTTVDDWSVLFSDEVTVPFAFRAGVAYSPVDLVVVGADLSYSDWSELDYAGRVTETEEGEDGSRRRAYYEEKIGFAVGAEVSVPSWPLRVRGGYAYRPVAYNGLEVTKDRSYFTLGAGVLIDTVLAIDFAWVSGSYERADDDYAFSETIDDSALLLEAAYRF